MTYPIECSKAHGHWTNPNTGSCYCGALKFAAGGDISLQRSKERTEEELQDLLFKCPLELNAIYQHYKGAKYEVLMLVLRESDCERLVIYRPFLSFTPIVWARPLSEWLEEVEHEGKKVPRYRKVD